MGRFGQVAAATAVALTAHCFFQLAPQLHSCSLLPGEQLTLFSRRVVTPDGVFAAAVSVQGGRITAVTPTAVAPPGALDYGAAVLSPGLVDVHVHMNEPGRADWEGFATATRAAAAGGVTTCVDMPLNSFPTTVTADVFARKLAAARGKLHVDVAFWGGLVPHNADNATELGELLDAGVVGLKAFMSPSGIDDFERTTPAHLAAALPSLGTWPGLDSVACSCSRAFQPSRSCAGSHAAHGACRVAAEVCASGASGRRRALVRNLRGDSSSTVGGRRDSRPGCVGERQDANPHRALGRRGQRGAGA